MVFVTATPYFKGIGRIRNLTHMRFPMAYITQPHSTTLSDIWSGISRFFARVGRAMIVASSGEARLRRVNALNAKTDEELAAMGLRREDITAYVFRDLMHM